MPREEQRQPGSATVPPARLTRDETVRLEALRIAVANRPNVSADMAVRAAETFAAYIAGKA